MKILVTGAQGQLARSLVERAQSRADLEMVALGRPGVDLEIPGSAAAAVETIRPDIVVNTAAYTAVDQAEDEPAQAFRINADAAGEIASAADRVGAAIIQLSTDYVFDGRSATAYTEYSAPHPLGVYGRSKLAGEEQVRAANPRHAIVRTAWVYSPFGKNFVKTIIEAARVRDSLHVVDDQVGSPTSALDLADALLRMTAVVGNAPGGALAVTYNIAGTGVTSWYHLADFVMGECRKRSLKWAEVHPIRSAEWPTKAPRPSNSALDSGRFQREFDFLIPAWQESVSIVVDRLAAGSVPGS